MKALRMVALCVTCAWALCLPGCTCEGEGDDRRGKRASAQAAESPSEQPANKPERQDAAPDPDPLAGLDEGLDDAPAPKAPRGECKTLEAPRRIWPKPGLASVVAQGGGFLMAGYASEGEGERVFVVRVGPTGMPQPVRTFELEARLKRERSAPPSLLALPDGRVWVAVVDGMGRLRTTALQADRAGGGGRLQTLAESVDARFAPAQAMVENERRLVAWTHAHDKGMRVRLAVLDARGEVESRRDLTPASMGATAPTFVQGAHPPRLLMVDAREGYSPLLEVRFDMKGKSREAQVLRPLARVTSPPKLAAAVSRAGTFVAYAALGQAATTAVGVLRLEDENAKPEALVPGTGYGALHIAAAATPSGAVFAADAPQKPGKSAPREIRVRRVTQGRIGDATVLRGPGGEGRGASLGRHAEGTLAVAFSSEAGVFLATLACQ